MFFALKGENFDGNLYASAALESGAKYAVVEIGSSISESADDRIIPVENVLKTLQALASYHRDNTYVDGKRLTVIGLTGTNGKTTTKELINCVLSVKYKVTCTQGNLNNDIGVPLTLLRINPETELAVIEMGANHPDDILHLVNVCHPDYGLITNVGKAHLQGFMDFEGVKKAKGQLYDYIKANGGEIFLNSDDGELTAMAGSRKGLESVKYGISLWNVTVLPSESGFLSIKLPLDLSNTGGESIILDSHLVGNYNANNILAAICIGLHFGVSVKEAVKAISDYVPANNRSQMLEKGSNKIIIDAYNANPSSMNVALDSFNAIISDSKIAMIGEMRELGSSSFEEHLSIVKKLCGMKVKQVYLVGNEFGKVLDSMATMEGIIWFEDSESLAKYIENHPVTNSIILLKGSRGIRMEKVIDKL